MPFGQRIYAFFLIKRSGKQALSRLNLELVAQGVRYRGETVLAYQTSGNHECSLNYYGPELFPQRGVLHLPKTVQSYFTQMDAACIREMWFLEDGRFMEVSGVTTKYHSAYERFSTCYPHGPSYRQGPGLAGLSARGDYRCLEDINNHPFDGRPGVFYEV